MIKIKNVSFLPDLDEIEVKFIKELINLKPEIDWDSAVLDLSVFMFRQKMGSNIFTHVTIFYECDLDIYAIFYNNEFIHVLENPNQNFFDDVFRCQRIPPSYLKENFSKYKYKSKNIKERIDILTLL